MIEERWHDLPGGDDVSADEKGGPDTADLIGALQDRVHVETGAARPAAPPAPAPVEGCEPCAAYHASHYSGLTPFCQPCYRDGVLAAAPFIKFWKLIRGHFWMIDEGELSEFAEKAGIVEYVEYDEKRHGEIEDAGPGDMVYVEKAAILALLDAPPGKS